MKEEDQQHGGKEMEVSNVGRNVEIQLHKQANVTVKSITSNINKQVIKKKKG